MVESPIVAETASSGDHAGTSIARKRQNSGTAARRVNESVQPWIVPVTAMSAIHDWTSATPLSSQAPLARMNWSKFAFVLAMALPFLPTMPSLD